MWLKLTNGIDKQNDKVIFGPFMLRIRKKYNKRSYKYGHKTCMQFSKNNFSLGIIYRKNVLSKRSIKMHRIKKLLQTCIVFFWGPMNYFI
jgi:hypothetical protein